MPEHIHCVEADDQASRICNASLINVIKNVHALEVKKQVDYFFCVFDDKKIQGTVLI